MKFIYCISFLLLFSTIGASSSVRTIPHKYLDTEFTSKLLNQALFFINKHKSEYFNLTGRSNDLVVHDLLELTSKVSKGVTYGLELAISASSCECSKVCQEGFILLHTLGECGFADHPMMWKVSVEIYHPIDGYYNVHILKVLEDASLFLSFPRHLKFLGFEHPNLLEGLFGEFREKHEKNYSESEYTERLKIFTYNMLKAKTYQRMEKGTAKYGMTRFSDLTAQEFKRFHTGLISGRSTVRKHPIELPKRSSLPSSFDWRKQGAVTPVKDQGQCGSCWAFATTGNIEGQWHRKTGELVSLSEQELLDCDSKDQACNGGLPEWAYESIIKLGGLMGEDAYPYEAKQEKVCHLKRSDVLVYINDSITLSSDETQMAAWLAQNGPISVGVNANFLQFYLGGVSHPPHILCSKAGLDHAVLIVGYGESGFLWWKRPYWIVKNSWGGGWGEEGYFRMYRGDGTCGINADPTSSIVK